MEDDSICDTNVMFLFPADVADNQNQIDYWTERFGFSTFERLPKGIVRINLKGGPYDSAVSNVGSSGEDTTS
jgi:hypothetical protein